jgi:hypothetical protein
MKRVNRETRSELSEAARTMTRIRMAATPQAHKDAHCAMMRARKAERRASRAAGGSERQAVNDTA